MSRRDSPDTVAERRARLQRERAKRRSALDARSLARGTEAPTAAGGGAAVDTQRRALPVRIVGGALRGFDAFVHDVADILAGAVRPFTGARTQGRSAGTHGGGAVRLAVDAPARGASGRSPGSTGRRTPAQERAANRRRVLLARRVRTVVVVAAVVALLIGWFTVPAMDAFRITHVEISGASSLPDLQVRRRIDPLLAHETAYTVDTAAIERNLEKMPFVLDARVERHFPGGIEVRITEYQPLALGIGENGGWLVARDGRVLAKADIDDWKGRVPLVRLTGRSIEPGLRVGDEPALRLLRSVPDDFLGTFQYVEVQRGALVGTLGDRTQVRFGRPNELPVKIAAAQRIIDYWSTASGLGGEIEYVDVSVPARSAVKPR